MRHLLIFMLMFLACIDVNDMDTVTLSVDDILGCWEHTEIIAQNNQIWREDTTRLEIVDAYPDYKSYDSIIVIEKISSEELPLNVKRGLLTIQEEYADTLSGFLDYYESDHIDRWIYMSKSSNETMWINENEYEKINCGDD